MDLAILRQATSRAQGKPCVVGKKYFVFYLADAENTMAVASAK